MINQQKDSELSIGNAILYFIEIVKFFLSKWLWYLIVAIVSFLVAFFTIKFTTKNYYAESNFVHEGGVSSTNLGSMFSQLGFSANDQVGLFNSNDNIVWLYGSFSQIAQALLKEYEDGAKKDVLINRFLEKAPEMDGFYKNFPKLKDIRFNNSDVYDQLSPEKNKIMRFCINNLKKEYLTVAKVNLTDNIIKVEVLFPDELFTYNFNINLTKIVNEFYIKTKTQQHNETISKIEQKVDSTQKLLNLDMEQMAVEVENIPYLNPSLQAPKVNYQKKGVDVQISTNMYLQYMQSLESAKLTLAQQTPIIKIIDSPLLPLPTRGLTPQLVYIISFATGFILLSIFILLQKLYKKALKEKKQGI